MSELDDMIADRGDSNDCGYMYSLPGGRVSLIEKRIEYMRKLGATESEVEEFCRKNRQFYVVRNMEIENAIKNEKIERAIELLSESKRIDKDNNELLQKYSCKLIELYRKNGKSAG